MATRSALASLPARLRPTSAATAVGGWRRLLSDDATKGRKDEDKGLKDSETEVLPMASNVPPGLAENEKNCLNGQLEQYKKEIRKLKELLEEAEAEKQELKNNTHKDLENRVSKQTVEFQTKLANHRMHVDESIRNLRHQSKEFKDDVMVEVENQKEKCPKMAEIGEEGTDVLQEKIVDFQNGLIKKVQRAQYNVVKTTGLAAVVIGVVMYVVLHFKTG